MYVSAECQQRPLEASENLDNTDQGKQRADLL